MKPNDRPKDAVAVLMSGGLDSAALAVELCGEYERVSPIYQRTGLAWESAELAALKRFLDAVQRASLGSLTVLDTPAGDVYGDHWSITGRGVPGATTPDDAVYLPGRNLLLLVKPAIWCARHGIGVLALGPLQSNPFPDSTPEFYAALQEALSRGLAHPIEIVRPFADLSKTEVIWRARDLPLELTLSCMQPRDGQHCGMCNKCAERQNGFRDAGVVDRTVYAVA
jgi:7-cyano-7-deazaguanine synthase